MKNLSAWDLLGMTAIATTFLLVVGAVGNCANQKSLEPKPDATVVAKIKANTVDTDPRGCQTSWLKLTIEGHEYIVFNPGCNGSSSLHSMSCTNCAQKQNTLNTRIGIVRDISTDIMTNGVILF